MKDSKQLFTREEDREKFRNEWNKITEILKKKYKKENEDVKIQER